MKTHYIDFFLNELLLLFSMDLNYVSAACVCVCVFVGGGGVGGGVGGGGFYGLTITMLLG